jgi:cytochrome b
MSKKPVLVWDLPVRVFHWTLATAVLGSFVTAKLGLMEWHGRIGGCVLALLLFRLLWGVLGSTTARFSQFVPTPARLRSYLQGKTQSPEIGHSPLGALSVMALIGAFFLQALMGLATTDDIAYDGPLVRSLPDEWVERAGSLHDALEPVLIGLVVLHLVAILVYLRRGKNLVRPMVTGHTDALHDSTPSRVQDGWTQRLAALGLLGLSAAPVVYLFAR